MSDSIKTSRLLNTRLNWNVPTICLKLKLRTEKNAPLWVMLWLHWGYPLIEGCAPVINITKTLNMFSLMLQLLNLVLIFTSLADTSGPRTALGPTGKCRFWDRGSWILTNTSFLQQIHLPNLQRAQYRQGQGAHCPCTTTLLGLAQLSQPFREHSSPVMLSKWGSGQNIRMSGKRKTVQLNRR